MLVMSLNILGTIATGFGAGLALIIAIGAQNVFVLRQGIRQEHVSLVVLFCMLSDIVLIAGGIYGIGTVITAVPAVVVVIRLGGAVFLIFYGVLAAKRASRPSTLTADSGHGRLSRKAVLLTLTALTWLNPHVYLDTVLLLGTLANQHGDLRWWFGAGAALGSVIWFSALGYSAKLLRPVFAKPGAWRVLDGLVAAVMLFLGVKLALGA